MSRFVEMCVRPKFFIISVISARFGEDPGDTVSNYRLSRARRGEIHFDSQRRNGFLK